MTTKHLLQGEPEDKQQFTEKFDQFYTEFARPYDKFVKSLPIWRNWLNQVLPWLQGPRILEVSFGTGYLLTQYAGQFQTYAIDYNSTMATIAHDNLEQHKRQASLQLADVAALPYASASFDTVVNTMAFSGYPDAVQALTEMRRVLKPGGRLVMIDINYPVNGNWPGVWLTTAWRYGGDIIRNMRHLFNQLGFQYTDLEIGGFGSVHLYIAVKQGGRKP